MKNYLVADLFCGAGGSSTGAEKAIKSLGKRMTLVCINHWPVAIETHKLNHPTARHYVEDVSVADPNRIVPEGKLDLLMASPECKWYSRARGGKPVLDQGRMNPWAIHRWLTDLKIRFLLIENVPEFVHWGPLLENGRPDPRHRGKYFQSWFFALQKMGYRAEWRMLNAADYGDATTRTRFFLIARRDRKPICWPEPTHSPNGEATMLGQLPRWRAAAEIINWNDIGRSLIDDPHYQRRPLSENTRRRIASGLKRFGGALAPYYIQLLGLESDGDSGGSSFIPFLIGKQSSPAIRGVDEPLPTIMTEGQIHIITPMVFTLGQQSCGAARSVDDPIPTVACAGAISLIQPIVLGQHKGVVRSAEDPLPTCATHGGISVISPLMVKYYGTGVCHSTDEPVPTVTTKDRVGLATPTAKPFFTEPVLVDVNHEGGDDRCRSIEAPLGTITSKRGTAIVRPFMVQWDQTGGNGQYTRSVEEPVPTIVTKQNTGIVESLAMGLVEPILKEVDASEIDPRRLVLIDDKPYLLDIRFRMLSNLELARAMGFTDQETTYEFVGNISEVTKQIGNAVPVNMAAALVKSIFI